jgi:hypothetical protein
MKASRCNSFCTRQPKRHLGHAARLAKYAVILIGVAAPSHHGSISLQGQTVIPTCRYGDHIAQTRWPLADSTLS